MVNIYLHSYLNEFLEKTEDFEYNENGVFRSEIFILYSLIKHFNSEIFIESGLDNGVSTKTLLKLIDKLYYGVDINPECKASEISKNNFIFLCGDSKKIIFDLIELNNERKFSIFIDGPKSEEAQQLKNSLLLNNNVDFVAIHDTYDYPKNDNDFRIFESSSNESYNIKYFDILNQKSMEDRRTIYNLKNNHGPNTYFECFPNGPGICIYSKKPINLIF